MRHIEFVSAINADVVARKAHGGRRPALRSVVRQLGEKGKEVVPSVDSSGSQEVLPVSSTAP